MELNENPKYCGSAFFVDNVEKSKKFYTDILGQKIDMDFGRCVGFIKRLLFMKL
jgi:catechol 2,3-dioxygenase-like lactoylglutathione lyase family enzyme